VYYVIVKIRQLLLEHLIAMEKEVGEERSWKQLAELIDIDYVYLNKIYNGKRKAGKKTIDQLANYFRDPRFYDVVGMDRPEPTTSYIRRNLGGVPDQVKKKIAEEVAKYTTELPPE
jgi:hypothetical protein